MIWTELVRRLAEVFREPLHEAHIVPDRSRGIVTTLEFLEQHLAKVGHSKVPPVTHTLSRPHNYSATTTVATTAPAASFSPATRKFRPKCPYSRQSRQVAKNAFIADCRRNTADLFAEFEARMGQMRRAGTHRSAHPHAAVSTALPNSKCENDAAPEDVSFGLAVRPAIRGRCEPRLNPHNDSR
jgi:hypothetical protein